MRYRGRYPGEIYRGATVPWERDTKLKPFADIFMALGFVRIYSYKLVYQGGVEICL